MMRRMRFDGGLGKPWRPMVTRSRGGTGTRTAQAHKAANPTCAHCGTIVGLQTDHIVPLHAGGTDEWRNLQSLCVECHKAKTHKDLERYQ